MKRFDVTWLENARVLAVSVPKEHIPAVINAVNALPFIDGYWDPHPTDTKIWAFPSLLMEQSDLPILEAACRAIVGEDTPDEVQS